MLARSEPPARLVPQARPDGSLRWLALLEPGTAAAFEAAVSAVAPRVEGALSARVIANRVEARGPGWLRLEPWRDAHRRFRSAARRLAGAAGALATTDVRDCYASIAPSLVAARLAELGCPEGHVQHLVAVLDRLRRGGVPGLPIGPSGSAVLANAVLSEGDRALDALGVEWLRWVDDVWVFASARSEARRALVALSDALGQSGLELSRVKTRVVHGRTAVQVRIARSGLSPAGEKYPGGPDAHPVPGLAGANAGLPADRRVDPRRRAARPARRER